jgi:TonB-linked SusC/RagA family outer membrane protein
VAENPFGTGIWGHFLREGNGNTVRSQDNPIAVAATNRDLSASNRLVANAYIDVTLLKDLTFRTIASLNANESHSNNYAEVNVRRYDRMEEKDELSFSGSNSRTLNLQSYLTYLFHINSDHRFNLVAGWEAEKYDGQNQNINVRDLQFPTLRQISGGDQTTRGGGGSLSRQDRRQSFYGRLVYSLYDRYTLTATLRRDGSSHFGPGNRYGTFPSAAVQWRISEEAFMKSQDIFSKLNLRLSWGRVGDAGNSTNEYVDQLTSNRIIYYFFTAAGNPVPSPGIAKTTLTDSNLKWETNETKNISMDFGFLKNTLSFTVDYFIRDTKDLLLRRSVRWSTGYQTIYTNAGLVRNSGLEVTANYQNRIGEWRYNIKLNGSTLKNEAIDIGEPLWSSSGVDGQDQWNNWARSVDGAPINQWYGYRVEGVFQNQAQIDEYNARAKAAGAARGENISYYQTANTKPGDFIYKDMNGSGHLTVDDRDVLGDGFAKLNYGLTLGLSYKNWDISVFMYGVGGQKILSYSQRKLTFNKIPGVGYKNILKTAYEQAWRTTNPTNEHSRLSNTDQNQNYRVSDYFIHNGDFLRMQNIQLGYSVPREWIRPLKMENVRLNASVDNLFIITGYKFGNPEVGGNSINTQGLDGGGYPLPKTFTFGISVGF